MAAKPILITSPPGYLDEGLFGRVYLWILDILPYLQRHSIYPAWAIPSALYGVGEGKIVIPGAIDLAYTPPDGPYNEISLVDLRNRHCNIFGNDFHAVSRLWKSYFSIPARVEDIVREIPFSPSILGIHFRGTDKFSTDYDTNYIDSEDMIALTKDFLKRNPRFQSIFVATDEPAFLEKLHAEIGIEIHTFGTGAHHKDKANFNHATYDLADRAMADSIGLSRCGAVMLTSSALSAFAKIFNPDLEIYRCAASKIYWDGPYYPLAYIPRYTTDDPACNAILQRTFSNDWITSPRAKRYRWDFTTRPNWPWRAHALIRKIKRIIKPLIGRKNGPVYFFHR